MFQRNMFIPSSVSNRKPNKKKVANTATCCVLAGFNAWLALKPEDGGDTFLQNIGGLVNYTLLYPRRWYTS
jgi:hypothetical protein